MRIFLACCLAMSCVSPAFSLGGDLKPTDAVIEYEAKATEGIVIKKYIIYKKDGENYLPVTMQEDEYNVGSIFANIGALDKRIAEYKDPEWIAKQISILETQRAEFTEMLSTLEQ